MSKSTLPELFKSDIFKIKFHPDDRPKKIGGRFTIKPSGYNVKQQSTERANSNQLNKLQVNINSNNKSIYEGVEGKHKSQSISNFPSGIVTNTDYNYKEKNSFIRQKKSISINNYIISPYNQQPTMGNIYLTTHRTNTPIRKPSSIYTSDTLTLKQIHNQNITRNKLYSTTIRINPPPSSKFPYQQTRSMNNMTIDMQQADNLKHRVDVIIEQQKSCQQLMFQISYQTQTIKHHITYFRTAYQSNLAQFTTLFKQKCKTLMSTLSKLRRQTTQQIRQNMFDMDRLNEDYKNAFGIFDMIDERSNVLRGECIDDRRLELTNRKTYSVDVEMRIQHSVRESQLERLLKRTKRSSTSNDNNRQQEQNTTPLPINTNLKQKAQTLSCKKNPAGENLQTNRTNNKLQQAQSLQLKSPKQLKQTTNLNKKQQDQSSQDQIDLAIEVESYQLPTLKEYVLDDY